jgi:hypothetical protein
VEGLVRGVGPHVHPFGVVDGESHVPRNESRWKGKVTTPPFSAADRSLQL